MTEGLQRSLQALAADGRSWCHLGQITSIEAHDHYGFLLNITLQPLGLEVQARPVWMMGGGQGEGIYAPMAVDDEVVVLVPEGDLNRAVAWPGPPSGPSKPPTGWDNDCISAVHSGGMEVRTAPSASVQKVVTEDLLPDLKAALDVLESLASALGVPVLPITSLTGKITAGSYRSPSLKA